MAEGEGGRGLRLLCTKGIENPQEGGVDLETKKKKNVQGNQ